MSQLNTRFRFKSCQPYFDKEKHGIKPNTMRYIDFSDFRFRQLVAWAELGFSSGDIEIEIVSFDNPADSFIRNIEDISTFNNLMMISWGHPNG